MDLDFFAVVRESQIGIWELVFAIGIAFLLGLCISLVYRRTFKGLSYSRSFVTAIVVLSPITAMVMLTIGSNLARAFGLVGALSIIRFRTAVKDTKDIMTIFLALVAGMAAGTGNYHVAVVGTLMVLLFIILMDRMDYGSFFDKSFLITFQMPQETFRENDFKELIEKYTGSYNLVNIVTIPGAKDLVEVTCKADNLDILARQNLIADLGKIEGMRNINIVSSRNYVDY